MQDRLKPGLQTDESAAVRSRRLSARSRRTLIVKSYDEMQDRLKPGLQTDESAAVRSRRLSAAQRERLAIPPNFVVGFDKAHSTGQFDNPYLWKAMAKYHDVVSVNYYSNWGPDPAQLAEWEQWSGRPILFTEWYAKAMDVPGLANRLGAGWLVRTQEDRRKYYQHFALRSLEALNVVGWHFFKYSDDPAESKALDSAGGANKGMFNLEGQPYPPLLDLARAVSFGVYPLIEFFEKRH